MKRHESLIPLSHDHHHGLHLAQIIKKNAPPVENMPVDIRAKAEYAVNKYNTELIKHFREEEDILFPAVRGKDWFTDTLLDEIVTEHRLISGLIDSLYDETKDMETQLDMLGRHLEAHIRKEERKLFPKIQELLSEEELQELANKILPRKN